LVALQLEKPLTLFPEALADLGRASVGKTVDTFPGSARWTWSPNDLGVCVRIAVVGAGITGLGAAWLLASRHEVVLFEAQDRWGGHSNTVDVQTPEGLVPVDTGFIVYNERNYPNLIALFDALSVTTASSTMSFAVSLRGGAYEYSGTGLSGLFAQKSNLANVAHWRMTADILRFHREAKALSEAVGSTVESLGQWLARNRYSQAFVENHILPMAAAIWSAPREAMLAFPVATFVRFFDNHGLLTAYNQPTWRTVAGGSKAYVSRLMGAFAGDRRRNDRVVAVEPGAAGVMIRTASGHAELFDRVAICSHADEALTLLSAARTAERRVLSNFKYADNEAVLHRDNRWMPRRRSVWSSWNYLSDNPSKPIVLTYWMNSLQPLATSTDLFVTLNPTRPILPDDVIARVTYAHPLYDAGAISAQAELGGIQGRDNVWFAGSYCGYGFHEDGLQAGLAIAEHMTRDNAPVRRPWTVANESGRLSWALPSKSHVSSQDLGEQ
jgi:uncharacterized protein